LEEALKQILDGQNLILKTLQQHSAQLETLQKGQQKLESRIENEVIDKIRILFDAREVQKDLNQQIINTLGRIEAKIDVLQLETAHIRRVK